MDIFCQDKIDFCHLRNRCPAEYNGTPEHTEQPKIFLTFLALSHYSPLILWRGRRNRIPNKFCDSGKSRRANLNTGATLKYTYPGQ